MKFISNSFALLFVFMMLSCGGKDALEVNPNLQGTWEASHSGYKWELKIMPYTSFYNRLSSCGGGVCVSTTMAEGDATIRKNKLSIGNKKWEIDQYPEQVTTSNGSQWKMVLDGVGYYK